MNFFNIIFFTVCIFSSIMWVGPARAEVKTTVNPSEYTILSITAIDNQMIQLEDGSTWQVKLEDEEIPLAEGDKVQLTNYGYPEQFVGIFKKISSSGSDAILYATLLDFPFADCHVIEKIQFVSWLGELQALVTLKDGSQWLFDELSTFSTWYWKAEDQILIAKSNNFHMYNLNTQTPPGRIVFYTIENDYEIQ